MDYGSYFHQVGMWRVKISSSLLYFGSMLILMGFVFFDDWASAAAKAQIYLGSWSLPGDLAQKPSRFIQLPVGVAAFHDVNLFPRPCKHS